MPLAIGRGVDWPSSSVDRGSLETLEQWPLCPDCETSQGSALVQYVRLKLA